MSGLDVNIALMFILGQGGWGHIAFLVKAGRSRLLMEGEAHHLPSKGGGVYAELGGVLCPVVSS